MFEEGSWTKLEEVGGSLIVDDVVLTVEEAAGLLKVSSKTVLKLARDGVFPGQKVGRAWRFRRSDLLGFVGGGHELGGVRE